MAEITGERMPTSADTTSTLSVPEKDAVEPAVPLERNLYGPFSAELLWERTSGKKEPTWESLYVHRISQLCLSVYVVDIKMVAKKKETHVESHRLVICGPGPTGPTGFQGRELRKGWLREEEKSPERSGVREREGSGEETVLQKKWWQSGVVRPGVWPKIPRVSLSPAQHSMVFEALEPSNVHVWSSLAHLVKPRRHGGQALIRPPPVRD